MKTSSLLSPPSVCSHYTHSGTDFKSGTQTKPRTRTLLSSLFRYYLPLNNSNRCVHTYLENA